MSLFTARTISSSLSLSHLRCLSLFSLFSMTVAMCDVCNECVCVLCVVLLCDVLWLGCACCCGCIVLCCVCARPVPLLVVPFLCSCTGNDPCVPSKQPCLTWHGHFDGTNGSVLKIHTGASRADCLSVCLFSSLSLSLFSSPSLLTRLSSLIAALPFSLSLFSQFSLSLFSSFTFSLLSFSCRPCLSLLNDTENDHVRTALTYPELPGCMGLGPFVGWRVAHITQKEVVQVFCASLEPFGMKKEGTKSFSHVGVCCWSTRGGGVVWCNVVCVLD